MNTKEFKTGYIATNLDVLTCDLRVRKMKGNPKNIFCTQKLREKVRVIL